MSCLFPLAKATISLASISARRRWEQALRDPKETHKKTEARILSHLQKILPDQPTRWSDYEGHQFWPEKDFLFFETTSGTGGLKKNIPYTRQSLKSFQNMFLIWAWDLLKNSPRRLRSGCTFISISPQISTTRSFNNDTEYLGGGKFFLKPFLAVDPQQQVGASSEEFFYRISKQLLHRKDLEILSLWSPSYFLSILSFIQDEFFKSQEPDWSDLWPQLKIISCWKEGPSSFSAQQLTRFFPDAWMQGKGLLSTEGAVTLPWIQAGGNLPLISETLIEFLDSTGQISTSWNLREGESYEVLISTMSGFLRYNLGDRVQVTGFFGSLPLLEFVGRGSAVSDLVGEKLDEAQIRNCLDAAVSCDYFVLPLPNPARYVLWCDKFFSASAVDKALRKSYQYSLARDLRQLAAPEAYHMPALQNRFYEFSENQGIRRGDLKEARLISRIDRAEAFHQYLIRRSDFSIRGVRPQTSSQESDIGKGDFSDNDL